MQDPRSSDIRLCHVFSPVKPELFVASGRSFWQAPELPATFVSHYDFSISKKWHFSFFGGRSG
jgi:hypothetical protein